jgi:hypothetical protein
MTRTAQPLNVEVVVVVPMVTVDRCRRRTAIPLNHPQRLTAPLARIGPHQHTSLYRFGRTFPSEVFPLVLRQRTRTRLDAVLLTIGDLLPVVPTVEGRLARIQRWMRHLFQRNEVVKATNACGETLTHV